MKKGFVGRLSFVLGGVALLLLSPLSAFAQEEFIEGVPEECAKVSNLAMTPEEAGAIKKTEVQTALRIMRSLGGNEREEFLINPIEYARTHPEIFNFPISTGRDAQLLAIAKSLTTDSLRAFTLGLRGGVRSGPVVFCPSMLPKRELLIPSNMDKQFLNPGTFQ